MLRENSPVIRGFTINVRMSSAHKRAAGFYFNSWSPKMKTSRTSEFIKRLKTAQTSLVLLLGVHLSVRQFTPGIKMRLQWPDVIPRYMQINTFIFLFAKTKRVGHNISNQRQIDIIRLTTYYISNQLQASRPKTLSRLLLWFWGKFFCLEVKNSSRSVTDAVDETVKHFSCEQGVNVSWFLLSSQQTWKSTALRR